METKFSFEMSVDSQRNARHYTPNDRTVHDHRCENLTTYTKAKSLLCLKGIHDRRMDTNSKDSRILYRLSLWFMEKTPPFPQLGGPQNRFICNSKETNLYLFGQPRLMITSRPGRFTPWLIILSIRGSGNP
jgi:hypothetical protein